MTAPDDMIRRGDAIDAMYGKPYGDAVAALLALPADPVAEAAGKLAEALTRRDAIVAADPFDAIEDRGGWATLVIGLTDAYRAAVAARAKETR